MAKINWTLQARNDLVSIAEFIAKGSPKFSKVQIARLRARVKQLEDFPESGRIVPEFEKEELRELILGNYRIVHRLITLEEVDIITIHHSSRILRF